MAKYSFDFKKEVVLAYLNGEGGYRYLAQLYGIPSKHRIEEWVCNYNAFGDKGLMRSRKNEIYSFEKKLSVVELYLTSELSYQDVALKEGILNPAIIVKWVNDFRVAGPDALRVRTRGRKKTVDITNKNVNSSVTEATPVDTSTEYVKQLEDELLKLRIENAFLKELRRLRLEDEAKMKELQESSAVSEDSLN